MADIVKIGRQHDRAASLPTFPVETSSLLNAVSPNTSNNVVGEDSAPSTEQGHQNLCSQNPSKSEMICSPYCIASQTVAYDEWPPVEQEVMSTSGLSGVDASAASETEMQSESKSDSGGANLSFGHQSSGIQVLEKDFAIENFDSGCIRSLTASTRQITVDRDATSCHFRGDSHEDVSCYNSHKHTIGHKKVSLATANLQQLTLQEEEQAVPPTQQDHGVMIPDHLKVSDIGGSYLRFGTFGSDVGSAALVSVPLRSVLEAGSFVTTNGSSVGHSDARKAEYHGIDQLRSTSDACRAAGNDIPSSSKPHVPKQDNLEAPYRHHDDFSLSVPDYLFESRQTSNSSLHYAQAKQNGINLSVFSIGMNAYSNSLPADLLQSATQSTRESDLSYSSLTVMQSMPAKHNALSSVSSPTVSIPEVLKSGAFSASRPTSLTLPDISFITGSALPQHLTMNPCSQPSLPLGLNSDMIDFQSLPRGYAHMRTALQQARQGSSSLFYQSPAAVQSASLNYNIPHYDTVSSLPQYADITSGHGRFGQSHHLQNPSTAPGSSAVSYDNIFSSQFNDRGHFTLLQKNDSPTMWIHSADSRTMATIPDSRYNSLSGQNQLIGYTQEHLWQRSQQNSQQIGALRNLNRYHPGIGNTQEDLWQSPTDRFFGGSQG